jgi:prolyl-tRNA synthetase
VAFRAAHTREPATYEELCAAVAEGFAWAWWCGSRDCEAKVKEETTATIRCIPFDEPGGAGKCVVCGADAQKKAVFARAY